MSIAEIREQLITTDKGAVRQCIELKQICDIMNNSVTDWVMSDGAMHFGDYGMNFGNQQKSMQSNVICP